MSTETPRGRAERIVGLSASPPGQRLAPPPSEAPTEAMPAVGPRPPAPPPVSGPPAPGPARPGGADRPGVATPVVADDAPEKPARRTGMGMPALALGVLAAGTCWTGWAGVVLGLFAVVAGFLGARRAFHGLATDGGSSLGGLVLGAVGLVVGAVVVWPTLFGTGNFGDGLTLDQCLAQSTSAKEMHMCKSQHITEFNQRYPDAAE